MIIYLIFNLRWHDSAQKSTNISYLPMYISTQQTPNQKHIQIIEIKYIAAPFRNGMIWNWIGRLKSLHDWIPVSILLKIRKSLS